MDLVAPIPLKKAGSDHCNIPSLTSHEGDKKKKILFARVCLHNQSING